MHILVVDDDQVTLRLLTENIKKLGHTVYEAENGVAAWNLLGKVSIDILVSDWMMPELNGLELCRKIRDADFKHYIYLILVSAQDSQQNILQGLETGVDDYITKPINFDELRARIKIGARTVSLERQLNLKYEDIKKNYYQTIRMFGHLMEIFNEELGGHCRRVSQLALELAKRHPDVSENDYPVLEAAGLLFEIGMVGLPPEILSKKRTEIAGDEKELYTAHPLRGEMILNEIDFLKPVAQLVRTHHEQFNGRGFPDGLKGSQIPLLSRILSAAAIYDNLIHRGQITFRDIPDNLHQLSGYQLDPEIVDLLLGINLEKMMDDEKKDYLEVSVEELVMGMTFVKDVRMKTGAMVIPRDTRITDYVIEKLNGYIKLNCVLNKFYISKSSVKA